MSKKYKRKQFEAFLFVMPGVLLMLCLVIYPTIRSFVMSFQSWNGVANAARKFVGLKNYIDVLTSPRFGKAMINSLYFMIGGFVIQMPASFLLALLVTSKIKFTGFFCFLYLLPVMLGTTAVGLMWTFMLNPQYGIFSGILNGARNGTQLIDWLSTPTLNTWIVVLVNCWMYMGYNMLIFAAGIVAIPEDIYDACKIDGCIGLKKLLYVTIPLCKNTFSVYAVLCITGCLKTFDIIWVMTKGGPMNTSATPALLLYTEGFQNKLMGRSSAIGMILLIMGLVISVVLNNTIFKQDDTF